MPDAKVHFFTEDVQFKLAHPRKLASWIKSSVKYEGATLKELNFIFCSDSYLHQINKQYLKHDTLTDIITFDNSGDSTGIEGDIFISVDRVKENAGMLKGSFEDELHRVIIHGVLHLLGYSDKTTSKIKEMRIKEDAYLSLR